MYKVNGQNVNGFTLIEAIVSLFLLSILSIMSYQAVEVVTGVNERSRNGVEDEAKLQRAWHCLLYTSPSPRDRTRSRMPSSA